VSRFDNNDGTWLALGAAALVAATRVAKARVGSSNEAARRRLRPVYNILARNIPSAVLEDNEIYTVPDNDQIEPPPYGGLSVMYRPHRDRKAGFVYQAKVSVPGRRREASKQIKIPASATHDPREVARLILAGVERWAPDLLDAPIDPYLALDEGWAEVLEIREQARTGFANTSSAVFQQMLAQQYGLTPNDVQAPLEVSQSRDRKKVQEWLDDHAEKYDLLRIDGWG
jgi:hypothetical protein